MMGTITIKQGENKFKIQIRQGNCLAVFIHVGKQDDGTYLHTLMQFFSDEEHLKKNMQICGQWRGKSTNILRCEKHEIEYALQGMCNAVEALSEVL